MFCDCSSDGSGGKKLIPAELKVTDHTVTVRDVERSKNVENTGLSESNEISEGDGSLQNSDGKTDLGDGNFIVWNGRKIMLLTPNFKDVIMQSAARLRIKLAEEKGVIMQDFRLAQ